uniref:Uncharacterized protein n=1 Tax=viral metagenome TaxID=1070528 RepID=A0A6C0ARC2_9ZZZZ
MNTEALILFLILLLGLVLCSFLGGNCGTEGFNGGIADRAKNRLNENSSQNGNINQNTNGSSTSSNVNFDNYNHYQGSSTELANGTTYYGENGGSVIVNTNSDGSQSLQVVIAGGQTPMTFSSQQSSTTEGYTTYSGVNGTATIFYGPNGGRATVVNGNNGQQAIRVQTSNGTYIFTQSGTYYNPNEISNTQYYGSTGSQIQQYNGAYGGSATQYYGPHGGSAGAVTGPNGNSAYYAQGPNGNTVAGTRSNNNQNYYDTLPPGIPARQIPNGQEDLYILKSQVVPPVCPACPVQTASCPREEPCPPCEPCGRCPEPAFECKKVPNYNAINNNYLPAPVLADFSSFGM